MSSVPLANANFVLDREAGHVTVAADWTGTAAARELLRHCWTCIMFMPASFESTQSEVSHNYLHVH
jgi:hypothetical protein